jgi:dTDP-glucose 4,6-dehydratase
MRLDPTKEYNKTILITGESGFIGSHMVDHMVKKYPNYMIYGLDALTYAANRDNTKHLEKYSNYEFIKADIANKDYINTLFTDLGITDVIHLAAESHVDNSIENPNVFVETNVIGTVNLLNAFKNLGGEGRFHHVSTDEVYGDLQMEDPAFLETTPYDPSSPYSASKAASDHFVKAYQRTYGIDTTMTNCSNNYGPHQHGEKLIPTVIRNFAEGNPVPVYGNGLNVRDWLYVRDHVKAIDMVFHEGKSGETYNVGGSVEMTNIDLVKKIGWIGYQRGWFGPNFEDQITFVKDRAGHDFRYAIDSSKLQYELGWSPNPDDFDKYLLETIDYYAEYILKPELPAK